METIIETMARAIVVTRDFCGDERRAAIDEALDYHGRKPIDAELAAAFTVANAEWRRSQQAAGVAPKYWR